jgi:hypothetical protein
MSFVADWAIANGLENSDAETVMGTDCDDVGVKMDGKGREVV